MAFRIFVGAVLVDLATALTLKELELESNVPSQALLRADTDDGSEIPPPNQAEHHRPHQRRSYRKLADGHEGEVREHMETYGSLRKRLWRNRNMTHSREILQYVMSHPQAPTLPTGGCLYLPNNAAWVSFYEQIEHPYPPLFTEMIANSYYPDCNATALTGVWLPSACGSDKMWGSKGCFKVSSLGRTAGIEIYETLGHIGLPDKWAQHIQRAKPHRHRRVNRAKQNANWSFPCGTSKRLKEVPKKSKLTIPTVYVVCRVSDDDNRITRQMVEDQNTWANQAYSGASPWQRMDFDDSRPESVDMQIRFTLQDVKFVTDKRCARDGFLNMDHVQKYNLRPLKEFTVVVITDDQSGILGQSEFPQDAPESSAEQVVVVSAAGFRKFPSKYEGDVTYDEGDTVVHEVGHGLGLYHTFEGGCDGWDNGDWVDDTVSEALPHYTCASSNSCGQMASDPVHNFMDYSPDTCMMGFTEGQKRRAWCMLKEYRPTLFQSSLSLA